MKRRTLKMKLLVIGLGSMGKRRVRLLKEYDLNIEIVGLDKQEKRRKEAEELYAIKTYDNLDKINLLPKSIIDLSPFHSSIFVTNVGSIGLDTIYHHIYNFGTVRNLFINREKERKNKNYRRRN